MSVAALAALSLSVWMKTDRRTKFVKESREKTPLRSCFDYTYVAGGSRNGDLWVSGAIKRAQCHHLATSAGPFFG